MSVIGAHPELSIIESTATASLKHGLTFTCSHHIRNLTIKTSASLASNYIMYGVRMNLDGVTISGGNQAVKWESVKVRGFNNSFTWTVGTPTTWTSCISMIWTCNAAGQPAPTLGVAYTPTV